MKLFLSCAPGLEPILAEEVREKRMGTPEEIPGGVLMKGGLRSIYRANLELGTAQQVRARLGEFRVANVGELARKTSKLELERWIDPARPLRIRAHSRGASKASRLHHTGALVDAVRTGVARRLDTMPPEGPDGAHLHARLIGDSFTLSVDTSGAPLHRRGYRLASGKAPLREDLAHALLRVSGWDRESMLIDPLAGAGTIVIEAALLASGNAPGATRPHEFQKVPCYDEPLWQRAKEALKVRDAPSIHASDRNAAAVQATQENAERAGVGVVAKQASLTEAVDWEALPETGALVTNPPWGDRLKGDPSALYRALAQRIASLPAAWKVAVVAPQNLGRLLGLRSALMTDARGSKVHFFVR